MGHGGGGSVGKAQQQLKTSRNKSRTKACNLLIIYNNIVFAAMPDSPLNHRIHTIIHLPLLRLLLLCLSLACGLVPGIDFKEKHLRLILFQPGLVPEKVKLLPCLLLLKQVTGSLGCITLAHCVSVEKCVLCCVFAWGRGCA
jgi:hypothetical protein